MRLGDWGTGRTTFAMRASEPEVAGLSWPKVRRAGATALLLAVTMVGCNKTKAEEQATAPELAAVEKRDLNVTAEASGLVEPIQTVEL